MKILIVISFLSTIIFLPIKAKNLASHKKTRMNASIICLAV